MFAQAGAEEWLQPNKGMLRIILKKAKFDRLPWLGHPRAPAGVRKAPRHEIAGCWALTVQRPYSGLWGFKERAGGRERRYVGDGGRLGSPGAAPAALQQGKLKPSTM
jgi:hypothetical protein